MVADHLPLSVFLAVNARRAQRDDALFSADDIGSHFHVAHRGQIAAGRDFDLRWLDRAAELHGRLGRPIFAHGIPSDPVSTSGPHVGHILAVRPDGFHRRHVAGEELAERVVKLVARGADRCRVVFGRTGRRAREKERRAKHRADEMEG